VEDSTYVKWGDLDGFLGSSQVELSLPVISVESLSSTNLLFK